MSTPQTNYVETYWSGVVQRLQAEVQVMNRLVPHRGEQGRANELTLFRLLESLLPMGVAVGSGVVFDSSGQASGQCDIILYNAASQPRFLAQTTQFLFPVETVLAVIEVKTTLDEEEIELVVESKKKVDALVASNDSESPPFYLMAYGAGLLPQTLVDKLAKVPIEFRPDYMCALSTATLAGRSKTNPSSYWAGVAALHALDDAGQRVPGAWEEPPSAVPGDPLSNIFARSGTTYPITRLSGRDRRKRVIAEPGRALLLFSERILSDLHDRGVVSEPFLSAYLKGSAHELFHLSLEA